MTTPGFIECATRAEARRSHRLLSHRGAISWIRHVYLLGGTYTGIDQRWAGRLAGLNSYDHPVTKVLGWVIMTTLDVALFRVLGFTGQQCAVMMLTVALSVFLMERVLL